MGELAALASSAMWAITSLIYARLGLTIHALALNLLKCTLALCMLVAALFLWGTVSSTVAFWPSKDGISLLVASGLIGITLGDTAYFLSLHRLGPRRALLLSALSPPFTALLAAVFLHEAISTAMFFGMILTLGGIFWVIRERHAHTKTTNYPNETINYPNETTNYPNETTKYPSSSFIEWQGIGWAILSACCQAAGNILTKKGGGTLPALPIATWRLAASVVGLLVVVVLLGRLRESLRPLGNGVQLRWLLLATFLGTFLGIWLQVAGLRYTSSAGIASTLSSTSPLFVLPLALFVLREPLSLRAILGAFLAVCGVAILFLF